MPSTANIDTVDPGLVDELERLNKLVDRLRSEVHFGGLWLKDEHFAEYRERIAAGKRTMDDEPVMAGDTPILIGELLAHEKALCEIEAAALAWIIESRHVIESADDPYPIPAELATVLRRYAAEAEKGGADA